MLKRTKGRILLTMLVVTGLAGTINNSTLSNQERKFAITRLKDTRTDLLAGIKGLSEKQLNFKPSAENLSIKECFYHIIHTEKVLWDKLDIAMMKPATPEKRLELKLSDEDILNTVNDPINEAVTAESRLRNNASFQSTSEAVSAFKSFRAVHLKYVKTTTEDLRNHFIQLPIGWIDCYQSIIFMSGYCSSRIRQINEILADPNFPKK